MKFDIKSLIKDKNVLRIVVFLSIMNVFGYLLAHDIDSVAFFGIVGFLATYFSKNMIVVLLIAMIATNFLTVLRRGKNVVEGMKAGRKTTDDKKQKGDGPAAADNEEDQEMSTGKPGKLDEAATVDAAYDNLSSVMDVDSVSKMEKSTEAFRKQQEALKESLVALEPMMGTASEMMNSFGGKEGVEGMLNRVEGMIDKIGGIMPSALADKIPGGTKKKQQK